MGAALDASPWGYLGWGQLWLPLPRDIWDGSSSEHSPPHRDIWEQLQALLRDIWDGGSSGCLSPEVFGMGAALSTSPQGYLGWGQLWVPVLLHI